MSRQWLDYVSSFAAQVEDETSATGFRAKKKNHLKMGLGPQWD